MVTEQVAARGVRDARVLRAMEAVPRHCFVPIADQRDAHADHPVPIGFDQTISQPYIVGFMIEAMALEPGSRVLEIGTGCGYVAALLAEMGCDVFTIEIIPELASAAQARLHHLGYDRVRVRWGDGWAGWPEAAPFDAILVSAAPPSVPPALLEQLGEGARLLIPVGEHRQDLWMHRRTAGGFTGEELCEVRFVPMVRSA